MPTCPSRRSPRACGGSPVCSRGSDATPAGSWIGAKDPSPMRSQPTDAAPQSGVPARASAHPVPSRRLPGALFSARMAARTAPRGAREIAGTPRTGSVDEIARHKRALLVTYRRDGTPVPTPVWAAPGGGRLYVRSERDAGKLKRLRNDARLLVAPCTVRGRPLGAPFEARARVLARAEEPIA